MIDELAEQDEHGGDVPVFQLGLLQQLLAEVLRVGQQRLRVSDAGVALLLGAPSSSSSAAAVSLVAGLAVAGAGAVRASGMCQGSRFIFFLPPSLALAMAWRLVLIPWLMFVVRVRRRNVSDGA